MYLVCYYVIWLYIHIDKACWSVRSGGEPAYHYLRNWSLSPKLEDFSKIAMPAGWSPSIIDITKYTNIIWTLLFQVRNSIWAVESYFKIPVRHQPRPVPGPESSRGECLPYAIPRLVTLLAAAVLLPWDGIIGTIHILISTVLNNRIRVFYGLAYWMPLII